MNTLVLMTATETSEAPKTTETTFGNLSEGDQIVLYGTLGHKVYEISAVEHGRGSTRYSYVGEHATWETPSDWPAKRVV